MRSGRSLAGYVYIAKWMDKYVIDTDRKKERKKIKRTDSKEKNYSRWVDHRLYIHENANEAA